MPIDRPEKPLEPGTLEEITERHRSANDFVKTTQLHRDREDLLQIIDRIANLQPHTDVRWQELNRLILQEDIINALYEPTQQESQYGRLQT